MATNRRTVEELKTMVAKQLAETVDIFNSDMEDIFFWGVKPVNNYSVDELLDSYINLNLAEINDFVDLEEYPDNGVLVAYVVDEVKNNEVVGNIYQTNPSEFRFELLGSAVEESNTKGI